MVCPGILFFPVQIFAKNGTPAEIRVSRWLGEMGCKWEGLHSNLPFFFRHSFSAKLPHRKGPSVRHIEGRGERVADIGRRRTDFVRKRPLRTLQGRYLCGSLAKTMSMGSGATRFAITTQLLVFLVDTKRSLSPEGQRPKPGLSTVSLQTARVAPRSAPLKQ